MKKTSNIQAVDLYFNRLYVTCFFTQTVVMLEVHVQKGCHCNSEFWLVNSWSLFSVETKLVSTYRVQAATRSHWSIAAGNVSQWCLFRMSLEAEKQLWNTYQATNLCAHTTHRISNQYMYKHVRRQGEPRGNRMCSMSCNHVTPSITINYGGWTKGVVHGKDRGVHTVSASKWL